MSILSFRALFRRFLTSKAKKSRNWNRLCLIASLWGAVLFIIGIEVPVLFQTANLPYYLGKFAYTDEYRELVHSKSTVLFGTSVFFSVLIAVQGVYFFIFWPGYDHTLVRTCVILVFVPVNLTFTWIRLMLQDDILAATIDLSKSQDYGTGLTNEEIQRKYDFIVRGMRRVGWMAAASSILLTIVQCAAVAFWIWLLPSRHRLPNRYEPVVFAKGPSWTANHGPDSIELAVLPPSDSSGRLEEIFKEHENARVLKLLPSSIGGPSTTGRRYVGRSPQGPRRHGTGPELAPDVRYWMLSNVESNLKLWVIEMAAFIVLNIGFEVPTYAIVRANGLRCPWHCHAGIFHPVVFILWLTAFVLLLVLRVPFNARLLQMIRVDLLLLITFCMSWVFWLAVHLPRYLSLSQEERDYLESLRGTPLYHPYEVAGGLQAVGTALCTAFGFALVGMAGIGLYQDYKSGRLRF